MSNTSKSERLFIDGPAGRLEAVLDFPPTDALLGAVVVCHPHPQHGGTMHNKVVHTLARTFVRLGYAALRFNFRGTENSAGRFDNGVGELDDALVAIAWLRATLPVTELWLAGFSFGAAIAVRAATQSSVDGLISVAPAVSRFAADLAQQPQCPWLIVHGDCDELVSVDETIDWVNGLAAGPELVILEGAEHFFHGRLTDLRGIVAEFVSSVGANAP